MAHDYKHAGTRAYKPKKKSATADKPKRSASNYRKGKGGMSTGTALFIGLALGLTIAGIVYFQLKPKEAAVVVNHPPKTAVNAKTAEKKPVATPKPEDEQSRFDFYSMLPKLEVVIPEKELAGNTNSSAGANEPPSLYLLQAGSFRRAEDADRMRAELALLGIESRVEAVVVKNKDTWHRVRVGPFSDTRQMGKIRNRLLDNGIDVMVLKVKS